MKKRRPPSERDFLLHYALVLLTESVARRESHRGFSFTLLEWSGNARRKALALARTDLFGARP